MTPFQDIFDKFLSQINDNTLAKFTDIELEEILTMYLRRSASLDFKECKQDLTYDTLFKMFNVELTEEEQWIIALGMVLAWINPQIQKESLLKLEISDRDFKESNHANLLDKLIKLKNITRDDLENYKYSYDFSDFGGFS